MTESTRPEASRKEGELSEEVREGTVAGAQKMGGRLAEEAGEAGGGPTMAKTQDAI